MSEVNTDELDQYERAKFESTMAGKALGVMWAMSKFELVAPVTLSTRF